MAKTKIIEPIAEEKFVLIRSDGSELPVIARIGMPYQIDENNWACPAELSGIDGQYPDMHGVGSMQALCLAIQTIKTRLGHLIENGEALYDINDRAYQWDKEQLQAVFGK
jgi:hypothetical protein